MRIFGHIEGYKPGAHFDSRKELSAARIHPPNQAGISGTPAEGADSIVLSGGYIDDEDFGDEIIYTGMGGRDAETGRQFYDQPLDRGNLALVKSHLEGLPVRVTRGYTHRSEHSPKSGYRYDGLFFISEYWHERGRDGFQVWRYRLIKIPDEQITVAGDEAIEGAAPGRRETRTLRIIRDSKLSKLVKELYNYRCQVCNIQLITPGGYYAEGAHIRPLGKPHNGTDSIDNLLCLCPNHHVLFDNLVFTISDDFMLIGIPGVLNVHPQHNISKANILYHREHRYKAIR
jgi:putative restriction endonuclease